MKQKKKQNEIIVRILIFFISWIMIVGFSLYPEIASETKSNDSKLRNNKIQAENNKVETKSEFELNELKIRSMNMFILNLGFIYEYYLTRHRKNNYKKIRKRISLGLVIISALILLIYLITAMGIIYYDEEKTAFIINIVGIHTLYEFKYLNLNLYYGLIFFSYFSYLFESSDIWIEKDVISRKTA